MHRRLVRLLSKATHQVICWYHDGLFTGRSLIYENAKPDNIPTENAIVGIYLRSPERNSDMPCVAAAH